MHPLGVLPREQDLGGGAGVHGELRADRDGVAQARGTLGRGDAHAVLALAAPQLGGLAGDVAQAGQDGAGGREQAVLAGGRGQLREPGAEDEPALHVAGDEAVVLERHREAVRGGPGQPGAGHQAGQGRRSGLEGRQHECGLVENADARSVVHIPIFSSQPVGCKPMVVPPAEVKESVVGKTLSEKVWDEHVVRSAAGEPDLLYIDLHLLHEVTSPQAFDGLRLADRTVRRPDLTLATEDHNVPTLDWDKPIADPVSRTQVETLRKNCAEFGVRLHPLGDVEQGIVHVVGPQLGLTQPGMTIVCGDSHTSTHGAFGAIAFGIGTSEVEHVLATQTLTQARPKTMAVTINGSLPEGVTAKDMVLTLIAHTGTGGGQGYIVEYRGQAIDELSMEGRMTVCNMSIEWGAKAGMIAPDQTTFDYIEGKPEAPKGADWDAAVAHWSTLRTDDDAVFDKEIVLDASTMTPFVTWGTNPGQGAPLGASVPSPDDFDEPNDKVATEKALHYMGLEAGTPLRDVKVDTVFVGSCTNGRIEDLRLAASILEGRHVADDTRLLVVPGSVRVRLQAEAEGLDKVFLAAGAEWRGAGCSMCLGMNPDQLAPGERSASTSNRNFEGRQGKGGRTHLVSVPVAAATAVRGTLSSPADLTPIGA